MARRRTTPEPPAPFKGAFSYINKMEVAVWRRTIDFTKFTATQMMEWLVPPDGLEHLRGAYPPRAGDLSAVGREGAMGALNVSLLHRLRQHQVPAAA